MTRTRTVITGAGARWALGTGAGVAAALALLADDAVSAGVGIGLTAVLAVLLLLPRVRPVVEANGDSIAAFAGDFKQRLLSGRYRTVTAFADNYPLTGVSRSTAYSAIGGARLPTAATTSKLLSTVLGADDDEITAWLARRAALEQPSGAAGTGQPVRMVRLRNAALAVVLAAAASAAFAVTLWRVAHPAAVAPRVCTPRADLRPHQVTAHVANTQGQGTYARLTPTEDCHTGFLPETDDITVACQDLRGPVITDVYRGVIRHWPVWDKLGSGAYISDLYTDLPKSTQPALVDGLPACQPG